jgi:hypothetical protein
MPAVTSRKPAGESGTAGLMVSADRRERRAHQRCLTGPGPLRKSVLPDLALHHDLVRRAVIS